MRAYHITLKGCPRCGGDLFPEHEAAGWSLSCLQCGYTHWLEPGFAGETEPAQGEAGVVLLALEKEKIAA